MIAIIDTGIVNVGSVRNMLMHIGASEPVITNDKAIVQQATKIVLPGIGHFDEAVKKLHQLDLFEVLNQKVIMQKTPILGICLGMQLITKRSEEGKLKGFGWIDADTVKFNFLNQDKQIRLPHMGWNTLKITQENTILESSYSEARYYFVHTYHVKCNCQKDVMATSTYGVEFHAAICKDNIMGTQFHPEKSHKYGMEIFKRFITL
jgi:glutamine amidotransferase